MKQPCEDRINLGTELGDSSRVHATFKRFVQCERPADHSGRHGAKVRGDNGRGIVTDAMVYWSVRKRES